MGGRLITTGGNLGCVLVPFPFFFELTERVDVSVEVATEVVCAVVAIPVWQDNDQGMCWKRQKWGCQNERLKFGWGICLGVCHVLYFFISALSFLYSVIDLYPKCHVATPSLLLSLLFQISLVLVFNGFAYLRWLQEKLHSCWILAPPQYDNTP